MNNWISTGRTTIMREATNLRKEPKPAYFVSNGKCRTETKEQK